MSGTTQSGTPISSLPLADTVSPTDTLVGVLTRNGTTQAQQVSVSVLATGISSAIGMDDAVTAAQAAAAEAAAKAEAAGENVSNAITGMRGKANGVAALDSTGALTLSDGDNLVSGLTVSPATQTATATLKPLLTLDGAAKVRTSEGDVLISDFSDRLPASAFYTDAQGYIRKIPAVVGTLPADVTLNGGVYMAGASSLPVGLSSNGGIVMTDGSVFYPNTINNGGVLCATSNATGA
ncbi:hypothetical protein [Gluconobacter morbifer]|uniref:Uncharacterized protein n=1 Tax=Gluconobacter morbifer G707 TaxID=1088869 RepID=G6XIQ8_9PROT|nr:hypothetical protein [Gluconobacter morbifer]EHH68366.1 hypothetical protein GMO_11360 [Gluconobacter morbifer G707]